MSWMHGLECIKERRSFIGQGGFPFELCKPRGDVYKLRDVQEAIYGLSGAVCCSALPEYPCTLLQL